MGNGLGPGRWAVDDTWDGGRPRSAPLWCHRRRRRFHLESPLWSDDGRPDVPYRPRGPLICRERFSGPGSVGPPPAARHSRSQGERHVHHPIPACDQPRPGAGRHRHRPAHGGARRHHRQRGSASHSTCPRVLGQRPGVGHHRLRPQLRRPAVAGRTSRRPAGPPPGLHVRVAAVLGRLVCRRLRHLPVVAAGGPGLPGGGRGVDRPDRAGPGGHQLRRGAGPQPGYGCGVPP